MKKIGFIGCGNMGSAMVGGLIKSGFKSAEDIIISTKSEESLKNLKDKFKNVTLTLDNNYAWDVQVLLEDKIGSTTYNLTLDRGIPITFFDREKRSVGINCFPTDNGSLEVAGNNILTRMLGYGQIANEVTGDWNTACGTASGIYMGNGLTHSPTGSTVAGWWWVIHLAHNNLYQRQIAFSFLNNSQIFTRIMNNGTWGDWTLMGQETYSTNETLTNKRWIDGSDIYRKVMYISSLPNATLTQYAHGVSNVKHFTNIYGMAYRDSDGYEQPINATRNSLSTMINARIAQGKTYLELETGTDRSDMYAYVVLEYIKNSIV